MPNIYPSTIFTVEPKFFIMKFLWICILITGITALLSAQTNKVGEGLKIGDEYQGGIIFSINEAGDHGLIAAPYDQTKEKVMWGPDGDTYALSPDNGQYNTDKIIEYFKNHRGDYQQTAAYICDRLDLNGYTDWYLPAIDELKLMYYEKQKIGNFLIGDYCSSTEMRKDDAYSVHFKPHRRVEFYYNKDNYDYFVRCIRKF